MSSTALTDRDANKVVDVVTRGDGKEALAVDAVLSASDIEIGAVEIKDGSSDQRATVDSTGALKIFDAVANSLVPSTYDYISLGYTGDNVTTVTFKSGGAGGTTVATLTLGYSGSNLTSVTKT